MTAEKQEILEGNKMIAGIDGWIRTTKSVMAFAIYSFQLTDNQTIIWETT